MRGASHSAEGFPCLYIFSHGPPFLQYLSPMFPHFTPFSPFPPIFPFSPFFLGYIFGNLIAGGVGNFWALRGSRIVLGRGDPPIGVCPGPSLGQGRASRAPEN